MIQPIGEILQDLLGLDLDVRNISAFQMVMRTFFIYAFTIALVRLGSKRFLSEATAFDVIIGIMLGSIMSRAINGSAPFVPTLAAGLAMVGIHWLLGLLSYHLDWFGPIVKGNPILLVRDGKIQRDGMRKAGLSNHDLVQALRLQAKTSDPSGIAEAYMERDGSISAIPQKNNPSVLDVHVEDGVQIVRIVLDKS